MTCKHGKKIFDLKDESELCFDCLRELAEFIIQEDKSLLEKLSKI